MTKKAFNLGLILLPVLILLKIFVIERAPFGNDNSTFAVASDKVITKIEMTCDGEKIVIDDVKGVWNVNGIPETNRSIITSFVALLYEIQIKSPVSDDIFNDVAVKPGIVPVKVKVFVKWRVIRTFIVYRTESNIYGNIMKTSERSKPFIVYAPGFDNNIGQYFDVNLPSWLPFTVFNVMPSAIQSVNMEYKNDTVSSFRIDNKDGLMVLSDYQGEISNIDSSKVNRYLSYYTYIPFEKWAFELSSEEKSKIKSEIPAIKITVTEKAGKVIELSLWNKMVSSEGVEVIDTDRVWGKLNTSEDILIMRYFDIDPVLKKRAYFITVNN